MEPIRRRTHFQILIELCGLSHQETADYLGVSRSTVRLWTNGLYRTPPDANYAMQMLWRRILAGEAKHSDMPPRSIETAQALEAFRQWDPDAVVAEVKPLGRGRPRKTIQVRKPLGG